MRAVAVAVGVLTVAGAVDVPYHVEVRVGIDARVDHVGVHVRNGSRAVARLGRARVGVYLVDAPGQRLCRGVVALVGLHALHPLVGAHRAEAPVGDAGGEAFEGVAVDEAYPQTVAPSHPFGRPTGIGCTLLQHDHVAIGRAGGFGG